MKSALVVEGGAMRGIFAAGVLDKFMEQDYYPFDFTLGVSAGATNLSTYVSKMQGLSKTIITQYATKREFFSPLRFIKGGHMTDVHWLWHHSKQSMNIPSPGEKSSMPLFVGITNAESGECEYIQATETNVDELMVASCALPTAYRDEIIINGTRYLDGGVADAIPAIKAYNMGARDITVILSQPLGFTKPEVKSTWLMQKMYGNQPAILEKMLKRATIYNETLDFLKQPPSDCIIRVIAPDEAFCVKRLTMDKKKLLKGYGQGRRMARRHLKNLNSNADGLNYQIA
ncbi:patatin-like phospholipase family protein [Alteromonas sp. PRIM-21]|uniref:patatin-like phospholipase family protein n=1 Tax=Alteromonas sp. PRIM-21 TaxID=1454978 RepID=UPI0022B9B90A|nr:patatin family protein [Alteromonas sp. PRIM-21]MCZ8529354.1 patatin family protein [Alteromonas sp. PRIM-21]